MAYIQPLPADLWTFLGVEAGNDARAQMLIGQAQNRVQEIRSTIPDGAEDIVLSAAARAYANPTQNSGEGVGPYNVQRPWPGVYLTAAEKTSIRRLGGGTAFTITPYLDTTALSDPADLP